MARLKKEVKLFIVRSLAVFNTPTEVVQSVQEEFQIKITRQMCEAYDPTKRTGQDLSQEFKDEFHATRQQYNENVRSVPIANQRVRLEHLQRIVNNAGKNSVLIMDAIKQAAQDEGGAFTNRKEQTGANGGAIQHIVAHKLIFVDANDSENQ